jgi:DNA-binding LacI/PurR family transcriptional regulator
MTENKPTSNDVARLAGVSQSTVSRSFDPNSPVSTTTRTKVLAAAAKLGYQPNVIARSLITQRTNIVGIVMASITRSQFYPAVLEQFAHQLQAKGKQILLLNAPPDRSVDEMLPQVLGYQVDALIIASLTPGNEIIDVSKRGGRPVILFNRHIPDSNASIVCCDNIQGGRLAADYLLDSGYQRIGYIAGQEGTSTNLMRERGFTDQLRARGHVGVIIEQADYAYDAGRAAVRRLFAQSGQPPDAVFCAADIIALGVLDAARYELGLQIPKDLAVIGFDDIPAASWPAYDLTTIRQPVDAMVSATIDLLKQDNQGAYQPETRILPVKLIERGST